jgi:hypothetical protein
MKRDRAFAAVARPRVNFNLVDEHPDSLSDRINRIEQNSMAPTTHVQPRRSIL